MAVGTMDVFLHQMFIKIVEILILIDFSKTWGL